MRVLRLALLALSAACAAFGQLTGPLISSISPSTVEAAGTDFDLTITGPPSSAFNTAYRVRWNSSVYYPSCLSLTQLRLRVSAAMIAAPGEVTIAVEDATGVVSNSLTLTIASPTPQLTSVQPTVIAAGSADAYLSLLGSKFTSVATAYWNGTAIPTRFGNASQLYATVPGSVRSAGTVSVTVANPGSAVSNALNVRVYQPSVISSLQPASVPVGSPDFTLTVAGSGFAEDSVVRWDSTPLPTVFVNSAALTVQIAASAVASAGSHTISVAGSNASGNTLSFVITGVTPSIISCSPAEWDIGQYYDMRIWVVASGVGQGSVLRWAGTTLSTSISLSSTQSTLGATVPTSLWPHTGKYELTVVNPGGETSSPIFVTIQPSMSTLIPLYYLSAGSTTTLSISGRGFSPLSVVEFTPPGGTATPISTTYIDPRSITAVVPASLSGSTGAASVRVRDGELISYPRTLTVVSPPKLTSLSRTSAMARSRYVSLTVTGENFVSGCAISWNGTTISSAMYDSSVIGTTLSTTIPDSLLLTPGTANITVDCNGSLSNASTFTISRSRPTLDSLSPNSAAAGESDLTLRLFGAGFELGSVAYYDSTPLATTFVSASELTAVIPGALKLLRGGHTIYVFNPPEGENDRSYTMSFFVGSVLTSISPTETASVASDILITAKGIGFVPASQLWVYGVYLKTTYVDSTTLQGVIPASLLAESAGSGYFTFLISTDGTSLPFFIRIFALARILPFSVTAGNAGFTLKAYGNEFREGATINWNGSPLETTFVSGSELNAAIGPNLIASAGTATITVKNPDGSVTRGITLTIESPPPPPPTAPVIYSPTPNFSYAGSSDLEVQISGMRLASGAVVKWNSTPLATTFVSDTLLKAVIPASLQKAPLNAVITATNPDGQVSNGVSFTVNRVSVYWISPASIAAGGGQFTMTVTGNGFAENAVVQCNGTAVQTTYVNSGRLDSLVPSQFIASPGTVVVSVLSGGYTTESKALSVYLQPAISALAPGRIDAPGPEFTLTVFGTGLMEGSTVYWGTTPLATVHVTNAELKATVPASLTAVGQSVSITVKLAEGPTSSALSFYVAPTLHSLTPVSVYRNSTNVTVTMKGVGLPPNYGLLFYDTQRGQRWGIRTISSDSTTIIGVIPDDALKNAAKAMIYLGSTSWPGLPFEVVGGFFIGSMSPTNAAKGSPDLTLRVLLAANTMSSTVVRWNGTPLATSVYATELTATVPAALLASSGNFTIDVKAADGSVSNAVTFEVYDPGPSISSIAPASVYTSDKPVDLTVNGSGFVQGSEVRLDGVPLPTTFISEARLTAVIPASELAVGKTAAVTVRNPGTGPSPSAVFKVLTRPYLTSVWPATALSGAAPFTLTVQGSFFESGSEALWDGVPLKTTFESPYTLKAEVATANLSKPGTATITVRLANGTASSNSAAVRVSGLSITSLTPASAKPGGPGFVLTVTGADFSKFSTVRWGSQTLDTAFIKSTELTAYVPASLIASPGVRQITVAENSLVTNAVQFTIGEFSITSVTPSQIDAGGPSFTLDVRGQGFLTGAKVRWSGAPLETTVISQNQVQAIVPAALIATAAVCQISVLNPGGQPSGDYSIYINPVLASVTPASAPKGSDAVTIAVRGAGFIPTNYIRFSAFNAATALATTYADATNLTAVIPANLLTAATQAEISVHDIDAVASRSLPFAIGDASFIQSLSPETVTYGGPAFTLTVNGSGFVQGATVRWNQSPLTTTYINGTQLTASVPAGLIAGEPTGGATVDVLNPDGSGSNSCAFHIVPALTSLEPSSAAVGSPSFVLTATGAGFRSGDTIRWNGTQLETSFASSTTRTATVPGSLLTIPITASITVGSGDSISQALPFPVTAGSLPASSSAGIVNAASYQTSVAPGSAISIFGSNLASGEAKAAGLPLPKMLNGASVLINGSAAPLFYVSPGQVNAQVPFETPLGTASLVAQVDGRSSAPVQFQVVAAAPGVFSIFDTNHAIAQNHPGWSLNSAQNPAAPGQYVTVYLTGVGRVDNPVEAGKPAPSEPLSKALGEVKVRVGGKAAEVPYAGLTPGFVGLAQVNLIVPPDAPPGEQPLEITIGGVASNLTVLSIKAVR